VVPRKEDSIAGLITSIASRGWRWLERIITVLGVMSTISIIALMVLTTSDVVKRYIFANPIKGAYEISESLFLTAVFLGLAYTHLFREHVNTDLFIRHLSKRANLILKAIMLLLALTIYVLFSWKGMEAFWTSLMEGEYRWGLIRIPLWPARLMIPIGVSALCLRFIGEIVINLRNLFRMGKGAS
jgi:TRAP-type mannitol/chloroaromatic compound transport system permease small subunit